jgi:predicted ATPase
VNPNQLVDDRFRLEHCVGSGGMGSVYRAHDTRTDQPVAVKLLRLDRQDLHPRFSREARLLAQLDHPAIVRYIAHGMTVDGHRYLAMEWLDGEDLDVRLERKPLTVGESLTLGSRVAAALGVAHKSGVIHRDIKPANLFLPGGRVEEVKLLDFGVARRLAQSSLLSESGSMIGTIGYIAPEQARGEPSVAAPVDVFSLGVVLFQCLTRRHPFEGDTPAAVLCRILLEAAPRLAELRDDLPPALDDLVARMLAKQPELRPQDGTALAAELAALAVDPQVLGREGGATISVLPGSLLMGDERHFASVVLLGNDAHPFDQTVDAKQRVSPMPVSKLREIAARHRGRVHLLVDGMMLVAFEPAAEATDEAANAARCALQMRESATDRGVAVATGRHHSSTSDRVGEAVERAARLLIGGQPGPYVYVDDVTAGLLGVRFEVQDRRLLRERGGVEEVRMLLGRATPCVGRERELKLLEHLARDCFDQRSAAAAMVTGPPGFGKSRLRSELVRRLAAGPTPPRIWVAFADPLANGVPHAMLGQLLTDASGARGGGSAAERRDRLRAFVARLLPADVVGDVGANVGANVVDRVAAFLGEVAGISFPAECCHELALARLDAKMMASEVRRAWSELCAAASTEPLLILLEDLHWGDRASVDRIEEALRELADRPLLVLALARPEIHAVLPSLWPEVGVQEVRLGGLSKKAGAELARAMLQEIADNDTIDQIVERANGNAFFLEELIRAVVEAHASGRDALGTLPETVLAMLQARLRGLDDEARRALRAASVFGQSFWRSALDDLLGGALDSPTLDRILAELARAEIIATTSASRFQGETELAFRHALLRDAAYSMLTDEDQRRGHLIAGAWLERHGESNAKVLAEHFERGAATDEERLRAVSFWLRAVRHALDATAIEAATEDAERGLALLSQVSDGPQRRSFELALNLRLGTALINARGYAAPEVEARFARAYELARTMGEAPALFTAVLGLVGRSLVCARCHDAREQAEICVRIAEREGDPNLHLESHRMKGMIAYQMGRFAEAQRHLELAIGLFAATRDRPYPFIGHWFPEVATLAFDALTSVALGSTERASAHERQTIEEAQRFGHPYTTAFGLCIVGMSAQQRGRVDEVQGRCRTAFEIATRYGFPFIVASTRCHLGWADVLQHGTADGIAMIERGIAEARALGALGYVSHLYCMLAEAELALARPDAARAAIAAARALGTDEAFAASAFDLLDGRAALAGATPETAQAERAFRASLTTARDQGARLWELRAATQLAKLHIAGGERETAARLMTEAPALDDGGGSLIQTEAAEVRAVLRTF